MGDIETMSRKSQETKKIRKRVNPNNKKQKKQKIKMTDKTSLDKMVKDTLHVESTLAYIQTVLFLGWMRKRNFNEKKEMRNFIIK